MKKRDRGRKQHPPQPPISDTRITRLLRENSVSVIIFLVLLCFITTFSNPGIFLNDEWISANQLYQLNAGQQVVFNEGPYGTYETGETTSYFISRGNVLQYTLILPLLALPVLKFFSLFGDNFRFPIVMLCSVIPMLVALLVGMCFPRYGKIGGVRWIWPAIVLSFLLFLANMAWYYPFAFTAPDAPKEVAALAFTNHILFALTGVILYHAARVIHSSDTWKGLFAMTVILASSSFLFWAGNAKDHMLVAFLFALVILFFLRYFRYHRYPDAASGFIAIGLLTWARPEMGLFTFLFTTAYFLYICFQQIRGNGEILQSFLKKASAVLFLVPGIAPFLVNNYIVTGNPFFPTFFVKRTIGQVPGLVNESIESGSAMIGETVMQNTTSLGEVVGIAVSFFTFSPAKVLFALPQVFLRPESGNMSLVAVCPLAVFALVTLILIIRKKISPETNPLLIYCILMVIAVFIAYIRVIPGLSTSGGIVPDMRYLSPAYIPVGLLGTVSLFTLLRCEPAKELMKKYTLIAIVLVPVIILALIIFRPFGGFYPGFSQFFMITVYAFIALVAAAWVVCRRGIVPYRYLVLATLILLVIPLCWQMMMVFLYSAGKYNHYPFWIPIVEQFFFTFIRVSRVG
ncbi:hypothetical protein ASZ90_016159 [hydrocarbon metagenome]|uniref:Glycosyltransferase RgtA/B/C/D-like domain-containing protein n=1 Tax=hydrocarbon metagenome TaxID=938273 RepID=A0A0W8F009_9ZZZZ